MVVRDAQRGRVGVQLLGDAQQHREAALHVGRPEPVQRVALDARHFVAAVGGHGVEVAAEQHAPVAPQLRAHDDVVRDAVDGERRRALTQARLDQVGERGLVVALRRHRDQRGGEREEILGGNLEDTAQGWVTSRRRGRAGCR